MNAAIIEILKNTKFDTSALSSAKLVGCYKMVFANGSWIGKWEARNETFKEDGATPAEKEILSAFAEWVNVEFDDGCGENMKKYINSHPEHMGKDGRMRATIPVDEISHIVAQYSTIEFMGEYPIILYLYRAAV
jgi:hypothetical protein